MAHRSAMRRLALLARSNPNSRSSPHLSPASSIKESVFVFVAAAPARHDESTWRGRGEEFAANFRIAGVLERVAVHFSDRESDESAGRFSGTLPPAHKFGRWSSTARDADRRERSSKVFGKAGNFGRFGTASGAAVCEAWTGPSRRCFGSGAASAEGSQIAVDGEQLESLQAGLAGVGDAAASLPGSDALSEVARAAADSSVPTALVQYAIDAVHVSTGLPWWAAIAATTVVIRILVLPLMVYQMRATARLTLLRPELEQLTNRIKDSSYDPKVVDDNQARMKALFVKHKTTPFSPLFGAFVQAPVFMCFFFGIRNMAEKMDSFKEGGALWFTDLSTPDSLFIMPVLSGAFFLLTVELGAADGMQGQPALAKMKMFMRGLSVLLVPLTASFPKALFCYWLTANICSIVQATFFKRRGVKDALGIPDVSHLANPIDTAVMPVTTFTQAPRMKGETRVARPKRQRQL